MNLQRLLNSREAGVWALRISSKLPLRLGGSLTRLIADRISLNRQLPLVQAVRANQWVISAGSLTEAELDLAVRNTLRHIAYSFYILFHYIDRPQTLQELVLFDSSIDALIARSKTPQRGLVVAGVHLSNFDLVLQAAGWRGLHGIAVSLPEATENRAAVEWQHIFRRQSGVEIVPASGSNLRMAIRRLKGGEIVLTGLDRPVPSPKHRPYFFDRPSHLPIHHIHLALAAQVPLLVMAAIQQPDGRYQILSSEEISLQSHPNRDTELMMNAERVLEVAAGFIRQAPEQWCVIHPVWPETIPEMP